MGKWIRSNLKSLIRVPAVYVVLRNDGIDNPRPLYIGQTKDLRERFQQHHLEFRKRHKRAVVVFSVRPVIQDRLALEQKLITRLNPLGNTHRRTLRCVKAIA